MPTLERLRSLRRAARGPSLFALAIVATVIAFRAERTVHWWMLAAAMAIVAAFGVTHGLREMRVLAAGVRLRRLARTRPTSAPSTFEERARRWERILHLLEGCFAVEAENAGAGEPPPDVLAAASDLMVDMINAYPAAEAGERQRMRELFAAHPSFAWATGLDAPIDSAEALRRSLVRYSLKDRKPDWRDETLVLEEILAAARKAGIDPAPVLREVAELSGDDAVEPGRSTRRALLDAAR